MIRKDKVINYSEELFKRKYPNAYTYLLKNKKELEKRDADKSAQWFEYGRSQALQNMNKKKLLISTVVTNMKLEQSQSHMQEYMWFQKKGMI